MMMPQSRCDDKCDSIYDKAVATKLETSFAVGTDDLGLTPSRKS